MEKAGQHRDLSPLLRDELEGWGERVRVKLKREGKQV